MYWKTHLNIFSLLPTHLYGEKLHSSKWFAMSTALKCQEQPLFLNLQLTLLFCTIFSRGLSTTFTVWLHWKENELKIDKQRTVYLCSKVIHEIYSRTTPIAKSKKSLHCQSCRCNPKSGHNFWKSRGQMGVHQDKFNAFLLAKEVLIPAAIIIIHWKIFAFLTCKST